MSYQENTDHIIWSDYHLDLEDWRESLLELYPHYSEDELYEKMYDSNAINLDDERYNLDIQLSAPILVIGDLGLWNGRRTGYKEINSGNVRDCLYSDTDYTTWYVDKNGEFRCDAIHHDGTNHYRYRAYRDGVSDEQIEDLKEKIYFGVATEKDIEKVTRRLGDDIGQVYGWTFPENVKAREGKQQLIKDAFADWIWKDQERRDRLCRLYNEKFNSVRPREYNGEHLNFVGINPEITLRPHQVNAIAHILYGGNTLLAHVVGAGKTFEMVAAAQESKRLGLCQKSLFVVPNHLTEQWAAEYLQLYPSANILVASKKDFESKNRKKFCGRIATGDYDAIIIGHSQFEKIPMSIERQQAILNQQLEEIMNGISELKRNRGENFSIKQLERAKKTVKQKLDKLNDQTRQRYKQGICLRRQCL